MLFLMFLVGITEGFSRRNTRNLLHAVMILRFGSRRIWQFWVLLDSGIIDDYRLFSFDSGVRGGYFVGCFCVSYDECDELITYGNRQ